MADRRPIRALTIWQPWAWCICPGPKIAPKRCENRTWTPHQLQPGDFLAIHAAAKVDPEREASEARYLRITLGVIVPPPEALPRGAIVGVATFDGVEVQPRWIEGPGGRMRKDPWWAGGGQVGWYLRDVVTLPAPVPCRGAQGVWELPPDVLDQVRAGYREARGGRAA